MDVVIEAVGLHAATRRRQCAPSARGASCSSSEVSDRHQDRHRLAAPPLQELTIKSTFHTRRRACGRPSAYRDGHVDPNAFITADASLDELPRVLGNSARGGDGLKTAILP